MYFVIPFWQTLDIFLYKHNNLGGGKKGIVIVSVNGAILSLTMDFSRVGSNVYS